MRIWNHLRQIQLGLVIGLVIATLVLPPSFLPDFVSDNTTVIAHECPDGQVHGELPDGTVICMSPPVCEAFETVETTLMTLGIGILVISIAVVPVAGPGVVGGIMGLDLILAAIGAGVSAGNSC